MLKSLALSVWSLQQLSFRDGKGLEDILDVVVRLGISEVELNEDYVRLPSYHGLTGLRRLRSAIESRGLKLLSTWFYTDFLGAVRISSVSELADQLKEYLATASELGAEQLTVPLGDGYAGLDIAQGRRTLLETLRAVLPFAEDLGVRVGIETGRAEGTFHTPSAVLALVKTLGSNYVRVVPDFEAWRRATPDLPITHVEAQVATAEPADLAIFEKCLPYAPIVHAKLLRLDEAGDEPHFPIEQLMAAIIKSPSPHTLEIEYEGWIPDIDPDRDCVEQTARCIALLRHHAAQGERQTRNGAAKVSNR